MTTLVVGARGNVGRSVVDQLLAAGQTVRASVRRTVGDEFPAEVEVVTADLADPDSFARALTGVRKVFLYAPAPDQVSAVISVLEKAKLELVVQLSSGSVLLESAAGNAIAEEHREVEEAFSRADLPWIPIRPLVLATNDLRWDVREPVKLVYPQARTAPIHEHDIAAVSVAALTHAVDPEVAAGMLTGGELLSQAERVALIAEAVGCQPQIQELTEAEARKVFGGGATPGAGSDSRGGDSQPDAILAFIRDAAAGGSPATNAVQTALGRAPLPYRQWVADHRLDFS
ncbi:NAD(P)H-binding protein [Kribbella sp. NPDC056861]|uniref:SDR family oxidoreductase n=1 Tax=Kribbella sp. NPDC056861 TaxID=3154857 RepID=UPI00343948AE